MDSAKRIAHEQRGSLRRDAGNESTKSHAAYDTSCYCVGARSIMPPRTDWCDGDRPAHEEPPGTEFTLTGNADGNSGGIMGGGLGNRMGQQDENIKVSTHKSPRRFRCSLAQLLARAMAR